jgi:hypothetical protein
MRHLQLVVDHQPAPTDFPPTWHEFAAARRRFFERLAADVKPAPRPEERASVEGPGTAAS